ncbi:MAG: hypothetical protein GYB68_16550 [Chloroflexi bacterium]|nr:hypothetical protein [Chloroflexota bacterium]
MSIKRKGIRRLRLPNHVMAYIMGVVLIFCIFSIFGSIVWAALNPDDIGFMAQATNDDFERTRPGLDAIVNYVGQQSCADALDEDCTRFLLPAELHTWPGQGNALACGVEDDLHFVAFATPTTVQFDLYLFMPEATQAEVMRPVEQGNMVIEIEPICGYRGGCSQQFDDEWFLCFMTLVDPPEETE